MSVLTPEFLQELFFFAFGFLVWNIWNVILHDGLHYFYYCYKSSEYKQWKVNLHKLENLNDMNLWVPSPMRDKSNDPKDFLLRSYQSLFCSYIAFYIPCKFWLKSGSILDAKVMNVILGLLCIHCAHYYLHRFAHLPGVYNIIHKTHHYFKTCEPYDSLYTHPFDNLCGMIFDSSPAIVFGNVYISVYLDYTMYDFIIANILFELAIAYEHCGINLPFNIWFNIPFDHEQHHQRTHCNYGTMFPLLDILHQTYSGTIFGIKFEPKKHWCIKQNWDVKV